MKRNLFCLILLTGVFFNTYVLAQPELDTTFFGTGKSGLQIPLIGAATDAVIQPDNKVVVFGSCFAWNWGSYSPLCLIRLNENGSFDTSFEGETVFPTPGYVFTIVPGINANDSRGGTGIAIQNDGKLVAFGYGTFSGQERIILARYNSDGSFDTTFGTNGFTVTAISGESYSGKIVILPDGKILVAGYIRPNSHQFVARYLPNGTLDSSFGNGGIATIGVISNQSASVSMDLQIDGKILIGSSWGTSLTSTPIILTRLNYNGSPDNTFDEDGTLIFDTGIFDNYFTSLALQTDGRILALGLKNTLHRFNADGSLDTSFNGTGSVTPLNGTADAYDVMVTASGRITVVGHTRLPGIGNIPIYYRIARYLPNGTPDTNFSDDGFLDIDVVDSQKDGALTVTNDFQGRTVIAGRSALGAAGNPWELPQFSVARLLAQPAQNVGFSGRVTNSDGTPVINAFINLQIGGKIIANTRTNPFGYFRFSNVQTNQTYTLSTRSKGLNFADRNVLVDDEITNYPIIGNDLPILVQGK